jgi:hypothetical protein
MKKIIIIISVIICASFLVGFWVAGYQKNLTSNDCEELIIDIEKRYQEASIADTENYTNDYDKFTASVDKKCPFVSTTLTGDCLDRLITTKEAELKNLIAELKNGAVRKRDAIKKEYETSAYEWDNLLEELPKYDQAWKTYSESYCGIKTSQIGGSAIVEESRKCKLFLIEQYIQLLKDQKDWAI